METSDSSDSDSVELYDSNFLFCAGSAGRSLCSFDGLSFFHCSRLSLTRTSIFSSSIIAMPTL